MSDDERVVQLLEEIRDQQREHLELYREAVKNQAASLGMQAEAVRMQRRAMTRLVPGLLAAIVVVVLLYLAMVLLGGHAYRG